MTASEQTVPKKNTKVAYSYQRYPMELYSTDPGLKPTVKVNTEAEEEAALAEGYSENPPAIAASIAVPQMTTQPALQASYDALKKELEGKTAEFNIKYSKLQLKHDALASQLKSLSDKHMELQGDYADLTAAHDALANQVPESAPNHMPAEDPFVQMPDLPEAEPTPKASRGRR